MTDRNGDKINVGDVLMLQGWQYTVTKDWCTAIEMERCGSGYTYVTTQDEIARAVIIPRLLCIFIAAPPGLRFLRFMPEDATAMLEAIMEQYKRGDISECDTGNAAYAVGQAMRLHEERRHA